MQAALAKDRIFQAPNVDIVVRAWQGKVNLSGWVGDAGDDLAARRIAASVSGVKKVTSNLRSWSSDTDERVGLPAAAAPADTAAPTVVGATAADLSLAGNVRTALLNERVFQAADVELVVRAAAAGRINLSGWIGDVNDEALARKVAAAVPGVRTVSLNLHSWSTESETGAATSVRAPKPAMPNVSGAGPADLALASEVRTAVLQSPKFQDADVEILVRAAKGRVNLSGWLSYAGNDVMARTIAAKGAGRDRAVTSDFKAWSTETDPRR